MDRVIAALRERQLQIGKPPAEASPTDPRKRIDRALTYYEYHRSRMNYPEYRRLGLPLTSSHIESTIKQINRRVKGTEKFWSKSTSEAVLQLRADYLSDSAPLDSFWLRPSSPSNWGEHLHPRYLIRLQSAECTRGGQFGRITQPTIARGLRMILPFAKYRSSPRPQHRFRRPISIAR